MDSQTASRASRVASERENDPGREIRARAWRYVFDCYEKKKAAAESAGDKGVEGKKSDPPKKNTRA